MPLNRRKEREIVFQMLFASLFSEEEDDKVLYETLIEEREEEGARESEYIRNTFFGARENRKQTEEKIAAAAEGWKIERFSRTTLAILHLAVYEMQLPEETLPEKIAINEAVELAKKYAEDGAKKFINGILGKLSGKQQ